MAPSETRESSDPIEKAERFMAQGDWKKAIDALRPILEAKPDTPMAEKALAKALMRRGYCEGELSEVSQAVQDLEKALELTRSVRDILLEGEVLVQLADCSWRSGDYPKANAQLDRALGLALKSNNERLQGLVHLIRGTVMTQSQRLDNAEREYREAVLLLERTGSSMELAKAYNNFGNNFIFKDDFAKAAEIYKKGIRTAQRTGWAPLIALTKMNRAHCLAELGRTKEALDEMDGVLPILQRAKDSYNVMGANETYGIIYARTGQFEKAEEHFFVARKMAQKFSSPYVHAKTLYQMGRMYKLMGDDGRAGRFLNEALEICRKHKIDQGSAKIEKELSKLNGRSH